MHIAGLAACCDAGLQRATELPMDFPTPTAAWGWGTDPVLVQTACVLG